VDSGKLKPVVGTVLPLNVLFGIAVFRIVGARPFPWNRRAIQTRCSHPFPSLLAVCCTFPEPRGVPRGWAETLLHKPECVIGEAAPRHSTPVLTSATSDSRTSFASVNCASQDRLAYRGTTNVPPAIDAIQYLGSKPTGILVNKVFAVCEGGL